MVSLIATSALAWIASIDQPDMMIAMTSYTPWAISLFVVSWIAGMAAMMFPAITPIVLMYNRLVTNEADNRSSQSSVTIQEEEKHEHNAILSFWMSLLYFDKASNQGIKIKKARMIKKVDLASISHLTGVDRRNSLDFFEI